MCRCLWVQKRTWSQTGGSLMRCIACVLPFHQQPTCVGLHRRVDPRRAQALADEFLVLDKSRAHPRSLMITSLPFLQNRCLILRFPLLPTPTLTTPLWTLPEGVFTRSETIKEVRTVNMHARASETTIEPHAGRVVQLKQPPALLSHAFCTLL